MTKSPTIFSLSNIQTSNIKNITHEKVKLPIPVDPWLNLLNQSRCEQKHLPMFLPKFIQMAASVFFTSLRLN